MGFTNPVSNAIGTLIRQALQSVNFVTGVSGWQITRPGNAEFNTGNFRGNLTIGTAPNQIILGQSIPALISNYYAAGGPNSQIGTVRGVELFEQNSQTFIYMALVTPNAGRPFLAFGGVESVGLVLSESFRITPGTIGANAFTSVWGPIRIETTGALNVFGLEEIFSGGVLQVDLGGAFTIDGLSQPRGWVGSSSSAANGVAFGGVETLQQTTGSITFRHGRAYEITVETQVQPSAANTAYFLAIRRGSGTAGTLYFFSGFECNFTTVATHISAKCRVNNNTVADITDTICYTMVRAVGAGTFQEIGASTQLRNLLVTDIGDLNTYAGMSLPL